MYQAEFPFPPLSLVDPLVDINSVTGEFDLSPTQTVPSISPAPTEDLFLPELYFEQYSTFIDPEAILENINLDLIKKEEIELEKQSAETTDQEQLNSKLAGKKRSRPATKKSSAEENKKTKKSEEAALPLSIEEEKQIKRQRRLIKNRESAQLSRQRKKQYVNELESRVKTLNEESDKLKIQVIELTNKNKQLEEELNYYKSQLPSRGADTGFLSSRNHPLSSSILDDKATRHSLTAGVCLFIILFSFGVFFDATPLHHASFPISNPIADKNPSVYVGRTLNELPPSPVLQLGVSPLPTEVSKLTHLAKEIKSELQETHNYPSPRQEESRKRESLELTVFSEKAGLNDIKETIQDSATSNSTFIYCSEAHQLTVPVEYEEREKRYESKENEDLLPIITLLLPTSVLNDTFPYLNEYIEDPDTLMEVTCRILNITVYPFFPTVEQYSNSPPLIDN